MRLSMLLFILAAVFQTWLALTVVFQFMRPSPRWRRHHRLIPSHIIPKWTFFAPSPGTVDYRIVFQDYRSEMDPVGSVQEIPLHVERRFAHAVWNPRKRVRKAFFDIAQQLQQLREVQPSPSDRSVDLGIQAAVPYLALLNVVMQPHPLSPQARYRRFLVVYTTGFDGETAPIPAFVSDLHPFTAER
jgi:hypothetical protein